MIEIPCYIKQFDDKQEAHFYANKRQVERRDLTPKELMEAIDLQPEKIIRDGSGRAGE